MPTEVILLTAGIFFARVADVSFGTLRMVAVIRAERLWAWIFGFIEVLIWIFAVAAVLQNLDHPVYAISYALGFATGGIVGIAIEERLAMGKQVVRVFSRRGHDIAVKVREEGFRATEFEGFGRSGPVSLLYVEVRRKSVPRVLEIARAVDPACFHVVEDIRSSSSASATGATVRGLRTFMRK